MTQVFLFDIDGTLTQPRRPMDGEMIDVFSAFVEAYPTYLVTGSDWPKLCEQVPEAIRHRCRGLFTCAGAEHWRAEARIGHRPCTFPDALIAAFEAEAAKSRFPLRLGRHVERRTGLLNVSVVGRNASAQARAAYREHDHRTGERRRIADVLSGRFPGYDFTIGGDISIDIAPEGWSKAQVLPTVLAAHPDATVHFFGDRMAEGGNDRPLAEAIAAMGAGHGAVAVEGPQDTQAHLTRYLAAGDRPAQRRAA